MDTSLQRSILLLLLTAVCPNTGSSSNGVSPYLFQHVQINEPIPSCSQLRFMWQELQKIVAHGLLTNELPIIPRELFDLMVNPQYPHRYLSSDRRSHFQKNPAQSAFHVRPISTEFSPEYNRNILKNQERVNSIPESLNILDADKELIIRQDLDAFSWPTEKNTPKGSFGGFSDAIKEYKAGSNQHLPFSSLSLDYPPMENIKDSKIHHFANPYDESVLGKFQPSSSSNPGAFEAFLDQEEGVFGNFADNLEERRPTHKTRMFASDNSEWMNTPMKINAKLHDPSDEVSKRICTEVHHQACTTSEHCACVGGSKFKCVAGQCQSVQEAAFEEAFFGSWLDGPLPSSQLGIKNRNKRKVRRSTVM